MLSVFPGIFCFGFPFEKNVSEQLFLEHLQCAWHHGRCWDVEMNTVNLVLEV